MELVTKDVFLNTIKCSALGWIVHSGLTKKPESTSDRLRKEEGLEIHERARAIFPGGHLIKGDNVSAAQTTQELIKDKNVPVLFEATFLANGFIAKSDILKREKSGWRLIEVKSKVKGDEEIKGKDKRDLIDDIAYTSMVAIQSGLLLTSCSLMVISKDYRLGMINEKLFAEIIYTDEVLQRAKELYALCKGVIQNISTETKPAPKLKWECKDCELFEECLGRGIKNHIFDLPRLSQKKFNELVDSGALEIENIPSNVELTPNQVKVRDAVKSGKTLVNKVGFNDALSSIVFPAYYLDFETVQTAIPLYPDIAPYVQIPTQYSLHICSAPGKIIKHLEYLADHSKDSRRELAERLIKDCGDKGSIIVFTAFEKTRIKELSELFSHLASALNALLGRLVDLNTIILENFYHPEFHGSYSIKIVLPVLVPDLSYDNMDVSNGLDASATFAYLAKGKFDEKETKEKRKKLLEYCKLDTLAMVKLHEQLTGYT